MKANWNQQSCITHHGDFTIRGAISISASQNIKQVPEGVVDILNKDERVEGVVVLWKSYDRPDSQPLVDPTPGVLYRRFEDEGEEAMRQLRAQAERTA